jgi:hypothetical protein
MSVVKDIISWVRMAFELEETNEVIPGSSEVSRIVMTKSIINLLDLPMDILYTIIEICLKKRIRKVVYPLLVLCKTMNRIIYTILEKLFDCNVEIKEEVETGNNWTQTRKWSVAFGFGHGRAEFMHTRKSKFDTRNTYTVYYEKFGT